MFRPPKSTVQLPVKLFQKHQSAISPAHQWCHPVLSPAKRLMEWCTMEYLQMWSGEQYFEVCLGQNLSTMSLWDLSAHICPNHSTCELVSTFIAKVHLCSLCSTCDISYSLESRWCIREKLLEDMDHPMVTTSSCYTLLFINTTQLKNQNSNPTKKHIGEIKAAPHTVNVWYVNYRRCLVYIGQ